jgi:hypothetical protein
MRAPRCIFLLFLLCFGCLEPYSPPTQAENANALVIDGYIDATGTASVRLSRTLPLGSYADFPIEKSATVTIESSAGESFKLKEDAAGQYNAAGLPVNPTTSYALHVHTSDGRDYESGDVQIHPTPEIARLYFGLSATGEAVEVKIDTRDVNPNATGYYAWESVETYEYHTPFFSRFKNIDGVPHLRVKGEYIDTCWREQNIPIVLATTKRLSSNLIYGKAISILPRLSPKISMRYSILARMRSISEQEYNYRTQLGKTNNGQNSIFAEIPGAVSGNVHSSTDTDELVLGYFWAQDVSQRRFFIENSELPIGFQEEAPLEDGCELETTCPTNQPPAGPNQCIDVNLLSNTKTLISAIEFRNSVVYTFTPNKCGDCRVKGGTTTRPWFW